MPGEHSCGMDGLRVHPKTGNCVNFQQELKGCVCLSELGLTGMTPGAFKLSLQTAFPLSLPSFIFHKESTMIKQMIKPGWISVDIYENISEDIYVDV